jgi:hypothetical protein
MNEAITYNLDNVSITVHENKRIQYKENDPIGKNGIVYLREAEPIVEFKDKNHTKLRIRRRAVFRCFCGKEFENEIQRIKRNTTESCGCLRTAHCKSLQNKWKKKNANTTKKSLEHVEKK